ncbi:hypothetical protein BJ973_002580 [Actinoplanes tereljensis]|uniref:DinB-like domain-containing protein n=1 Tax=Paractinoplanes tereljensis TaxID=571912 RepID=A0A919NQK4_9ACTN|nr:DinB family protein [Actinoplanes tereljensis]GIF22256.1 hypothetical protein Ate02nite_49860 [Actinoplanes tereljensis]
MAEFIHDDLRGSTFEQVDLSGARFHHCQLNGVGLSGVRMRGVELRDVEITGELAGVTVNGVEIAPLVEAELNRRHPERHQMRPTDPDGFREAWATLERLWAGTVARAQRLPPERLHESVEGEWSFIETLRHLVFVTDAWIRRGIQGQPAPWHPLSLPWDGMSDTPGVPRDRAARPSLETVLALRADRVAGVRVLLASLTPEQLEAHTVAVDAPGWPPPQSFPARECLEVLLNEEWEHRLFAERDLAVLEASPIDHLPGR